MVFATKRISTAAACSAQYSPVDTARGVEAGMPGLGGRVGCAATLYPDRESDGAGKDRENFSELSALSFEEVVTASRAILLKEKRKLRRLVSMLKQRMREVDCDLRRLPEGEIDGKFYGVLLTKEDLNEVLARR
jgi:hypothetical protein